MQDSEAPGLPKTLSNSPPCVHAFTMAKSSGTEPLPGDGKNRKKNRRNRERLRRKNRRERAIGALHISTLPPVVRTLRRSAREAPYKTANPYQWIQPWIRDPFYKYSWTQYPDAHLLGLPAELRQTILDMSLAPPPIHGVSRIFRAELLCRRIGELCSVAPAMRVDMAYVGQQWIKKYIDSNRSFDLSAHLVDLPKWFKEKRAKLVLMQKGIRRKKKIPVDEGENVKSGQKLRPKKCKHCCQRHPTGDPLCPLARQDPQLWRKLTKPLKSTSKRPRARGACAGFQGARAVFEE